MKSKLIFITSVMALVLTFGLLSISVFAAVSQNFGVNNRIVFVGNSLLSFDIDAEITGTKKDGDDSLKYNWSYSNENDMPNSDTWSLAEDLTFDEEGKEINPTAVNRVSITYTFTVENLSDTLNIAVYIENPTSIDTSVLTTNINGSANNKVVIAPKQTGVVSIEVIPLERFQGAKTCNFSLRIDPQE